MAKPTLICLNRGPWGVSSVTQYGALDPGYPNLYGQFAESVADTEICEEVFAALAEDLQADGLVTSDGRHRLMRETPITAVQQRVAVVSPISALAS